jgi:hypothetical protein
VTATVDTDDDHGRRRCGVARETALLSELADRVGLPPRTARVTYTGFNKPVKVGTAGSLRTHARRSPEGAG